MQNAVIVSATRTAVGQPWTNITPLTSNEHWTAFAPGELKVFVDGLPQRL